MGLGWIEGSYLKIIVIQNMQFLKCIQKNPNLMPLQMENIWSNKEMKKNSFGLFSLSCFIKHYNWSFGMF